MKDKICSKEQKLKNLNISYISNIGASISNGAKVKLFLQQVSFSYNIFETVDQYIIDNNNKNALI